MNTSTAATSPSQSVPSLAEASRGSADSDELQSPVLKTKNIVDLGFAQSLSSLVDEQGDDGDMKDEDDQLARRSSVSSETSDAPSNFEIASSTVSNDLFAFMRNRTLQEEKEDVSIRPSCHGGLNLAPKQLAEVFKMFGSPDEKALSTVSSGLKDDASTAVTSNVACKNEVCVRKMESLERECQTLKDIIRVDSVNMLKLRRALDTLRADAANDALEIKQLREEVMLAKRETEAVRERESQHLETNWILKQEVDNLSQAPHTITDEVEQLELEKEMLADQFFDVQVELREKSAIIDFLQTENAAMRERIEFLQGKLKQEYEDERSQLASQVELLAERLSDMEKDRDEAMFSIVSENRRREEEIELLKQMILKHQAAQPDEPVEVALNETLPQTTADQTAQTDTTVSWGVLCDCFPMAKGSNKEEK